jgi:hypothetical protein
MMLGKTPARPDAIKLKLKKYLNLSVLPTPPEEFGHEDLIPIWDTLGNDSYGDCVWAGAAHETMLWNKEAGVDISFDDGAVLSDYAAVTGFDPNDPSTDNGTDMQQAASYRKKTGVIDAAGSRHLIGAYLEIQKGNLEEHLAAAYIFSAVGLGIEFPHSAMDQFNNGQPWVPVDGDPIDGGHYVPITARRSGLWLVCTWGALQQVSDDFFTKYNDESVVYLSNEALVGNKTIDGFDLEQLQADLAALSS